VVEWSAATTAFWGVVALITVLVSDRHAQRRPFLVPLGLCVLCQGAAVVLALSGHG